MKKNIYLPMILLFLSIVSVAQETAPELSSTTFKPAAGDINLELNFNPSAIFSDAGFNQLFELPYGIKLRKFKSDKKAFRIGIDMSMLNYINIIQQENPDFNAIELKQKYSSFYMTITPGIEKHFSGTERLSPYLGGVFVLGWGTSMDKRERQAGTDIEVATTKNGSFSDGIVIGVGAVAGLDYYIAKKLYLGLELNATFRYYIQATETRIAYDGTETKYNRGSDVSFNPYANPSFRLGYFF